MANNKEKDILGETRQRKILLMPNADTENNCPPTELTLHDQRSTGDEESGGFNPYDTAVLCKK